MSIEFQDPCDTAEATALISVAGPLARYQAAVAARQIAPDGFQRSVVERLEALHQGLGGYQPAALARPGWRHWFLREKTAPAPRGLYIHGSVGRGKSMLMDLFFAAAPVACKRRVHFHAFMAEIHDRLHQQRTQTGGPEPMARLVQDLARDAWLLCFDEFVVNNIADAMILGRLFQGLFDQGVVVVATSNFAPQDLYLDGLQRERFLPFIDMLARNLEVVGLDGFVDYRRKGLAGGPVYFTPLDRQASLNLAACWDVMTDAAVGEPAVVHHHGRAITVPRAAGGVAWFRFEDLCVAALGANDYLALTRHYHGFLVEGVPRLLPARHDEARRFITLIDTLYEAKAHLVLTAAAVPDRLYEEGLATFEFTRTVSRLLEMQSAHYLARPRVTLPQAPLDHPEPERALLRLRPASPHKRAQMP